MKHLALICFFFSVVAVGTMADAIAQGNRINCDNAGSNIEIGACLNRDLSAADAELNRVYQAAMAAIERNDHLTPDLRAKWKVALRAAQRLWISYRDADCRETIIYEWWGGSITSIAVLGCLLEKTRTRTAELRERYIPH